MPRLGPRRRWHRSIGTGRGKESRATTFVGATARAGSGVGRSHVVGTRSASGSSRSGRASSGSSMTLRQSASVTSLPGGSRGTSVACGRQPSSGRRSRCVGSTGLSRYYVEEITAARVEEIVMAGGSRQGQIALRLIKMALSDARVRGQQVHEPIFAIRPPRHETRDPRFLTWAEVEELASYCREHRLIVVAALTGLRRGELFALTAANVDLDGATITVAATGDGGKVGRPKGGEGAARPRRARMVELLEEQLVERVPNGGDLVFPSPRGEMWDGSNFRDADLQPGKEAGGAGRDDLP